MYQSDFFVLLKSCEEGMEKECDSCRLEIGKKVEKGEASKVLFNLTITDLIPIMFQKLWVDDKKDAATVFYKFKV